MSKSMKPGSIIDNQELQRIFKCSARGGMRRSHKTNTLVLISDYTKALYEDRWGDNIFYYTGMGRIGDQGLDLFQNKTLAESSNIDINVHLFEVFEPGRYTYIGQVEHFGTPVQEDQSDETNKVRKVWIFPLKLKNPYPKIPHASVEKKQKARQRLATRLSKNELEKRANHSKKGVGKRDVTSSVYERNEYVAELAKRYADGRCELCEDNAPFEDKTKRPFLESHHIVWLSRHGDDVIENTVALCPNCHRRMHILDIAADKKYLENKVSSRE